MINSGKENIVWAWECPVTGIVFDETWGATLPYAEGKTQRWLGKNRFKQGEMRAFRLTLERLTDAEEKELQAKFAEWRKEQDAKRANA